MLWFFREFWRSRLIWEWVASRYKFSERNIIKMFDSLFNNNIVQIINLTVFFYKVIVTSPFNIHIGLDIIL